MKLATLFLAAVAGVASAAQETICTPEKVNSDCTLRLSRYYPVALPTLQIRRNSKVRVVIAEPVPFETLSLDFQSAQSVVPTDPTQAMVTALLGQSKSLVAVSGMTIRSFEAPVAPAPQSHEEVVKKVRDIDDRLNQLLKDTQTFITDAIGVYAELAEVTGTISPQTFFGRRNSIIDRRGTPAPWNRFSDWQAWMLCEIGACPSHPVPQTPVRGLLTTAAFLTAAVDSELKTCETEASPECPLSNLAIAISQLPDEQRKTLQNALTGLHDKRAALRAANTAIGAAVKDLGTYYVNINQLDPPQPVKEIELGLITDPVENADINTFVSKLLGRQVVFSINAANNVSVPVSSVPSAAQKKSLATITVVYGDPIVEASAGAFFSFLPNRSFSNQTAVTLNANAVPVTGNIYIAETKSYPTVIPFAAVNVRVGRDFLVGRRRGAFYGTGALGINTSNGSTEFGFGPTFSWRSLMFSAPLAPRTRPTFDARSIHGTSLVQHRSRNWVDSQVRRYAPRPIHGKVLDS